MNPYRERLEQQLTTAEGRLRYARACKTLFDVNKDAWAFISGSLAEAIKDCFNEFMGTGSMVDVAGLKGEIRAYQFLLGLPKARAEELDGLEKQVAFLRKRLGEVQDLNIGELRPAAVALRKEMRTIAAAGARR